MKRIHSLGLVLVALACATPAAAQIDFSRELDQVDAAVMALAASSKDFPADLAVVTRLHGHIATLRQTTDPARFDCLMDQASLLLGNGDLHGARRFTAEAVAQAQSHGQALEAAEASVTAAALAQRAGDFEAERVFRLNARTLALSPTVAPADANAIAARLYGAAWKAAAGGMGVLIDE